MKTYININGTRYPARVTGCASDPAWGGRATKLVTLELTHGEAEALFVDGLKWSIIHERDPYTNKAGETVDPKPVEIDCSGYDMAGSITDNRDGTVTIRMGKSTPAEVLAAVAEVGGTLRLDEQKQLRAAIETAAESLDDRTASEVPGLLRSMRGDGKLIPAGTRIRWGGTVKRAAADLWDTAENSPDNAPTLWEDIGYKKGCRVIPETITAGTAFAKGEKGWWGDVLYISKADANVYTPEQYGDNWEVAT